MSNMDKAVFSHQEATRVLDMWGQMCRTRQTFDYWNPADDSSNKFKGDCNSDEEFSKWLDGLPAEAREVKWRNYKISCANMCAFNNHSWGPWYESSMDVRGHSVTMPGATAGIWGKDGKTVVSVSEWPHAKDDKVVDWDQAHNGYFYAAK